jgi:phasin family protein
MQNMNALPKTSEIVDLVGKSQAQFQDSFRTTAKQAEEFVSLGQGNFEAVVKATQVWTAGVQDLAKQVAASAQASVEEAVATAKALSSVKSPQEALELQTKLIQSSLEKTLAEASRIGEASLKLFQDTVAPLSARATLAVEKATKTS